MTPVGLHIQNSITWSGRVLLQLCLGLHPDQRQ